MQDEKSAIYQMRFPQKLWYLLNLQTDAILWGGKGRTILLNYKILRSYLQCGHSIFKTNNISSFVRQLNLYGFRKVTSHSQDPLCNSSNPYMHEYIHDYFQYGRPELLNKITRKAFAIKKPMKTKADSNNVNGSPYMTPLQKARQIFRLALKKAAGDIYMQDQPNTFQSDDIENCADEEEDYEDKFEWFITQCNEKNGNSKGNQPDAQGTNAIGVPLSVDNSSQNNLPKNMEIVACTNHNGQETDETNQYLNMPDVQRTSEHHQGIELLAEFDINNDLDQGIARRIGERENFNKENVNSLNCVLPSLTIDPFQTMMEHNSDFPPDYNGEWDQMLCEMLATRTTSQEIGSDFKELFSQITKTMDGLHS